MNITKTGYLFLLSVVTAACLLLVTACDMPIGLGSRVNTTVPRITPGPGDNQPGAFLRGDRNLIKLDIQQPFGLSSVFMDIWYFDLDGIERERRIPASMGTDDLWVVNIDTTGMRDGTIRGQVTAIDGDGNRTTTTELVYTVKNTPPQIELTIPRMSGNEFDRITTYTPVLNAGSIFWGNDIMGIASDAFGIAHGYPQIRLWPVRDPETGFYPEGVSPGDFYSISGLPRPGTEWYDWRPMLDEQGRPFDNPHTVNSNLRATQFRWPLQNRAGNELATGYYRFQIQTRDRFGILNTYPKRLDHELPEGSPRNEYFQIQIIATDNPIIRWSPAGNPVGYEGFPNFFSASEDLVVYLTIRTGNTLSRAGTRARLSIHDRIEDNEWESGDYRFIDHVSGNLHRITMSRDDVTRMLGGEAQLSGDRILHVEAVDSLGNKSATSRPIIIDNTPPTMMFIEPVGLEPGANPRVTSTVTFRGSALDNQRVARMYYALGTTEVNNPLLGRTLEDTTGWTDTGLHSNNPLQGHPHGPGLAAARVSWSGTLSSWNWRFTNIADVTSSVPAQNHFVTRDGDPEQNLWLLPIEFRLVDIAGNVSFYRVNVLVDPDADLPLVFINSHVTGQTVGGQIRIGGTAEDNEMIHNVQVRIFRQSNAVLGTDAAPAELVQNWTSVNTPANNSAAISWHTIINRGGELDPPPGYRIRRVRLDFRAIDALPGSPHIPKDYGPVTSLFLDFDNTVPFIYTPVLLRGSPSEIGEANLLTASGVEFDHVAGSLLSGFVTMRVRARDESGLISIRMRGGGVPQFYELLPAARGFNDVDPWVVTPTLMTAGGHITAGRKYRIIEIGMFHNLRDFQGTIQSEYLVNETTFIASSSGTLSGQGTVLMEANAGEFQDFEYTIFIPLNTDGTSRFGSGFAHQAGPVALEIQVADNSTPTPFITQNTYQLRVDNRHPLGIFTGNLTVTHPRYTIAGSAWDSGSGVQVQGVDRVVVYFYRPDPVNANNAIPLSLSGVPVNTGWVNNQSVLINRTGTNNEVAEQGTPHTLPFFPSNFEANGTGISISAAASVPAGARFTAISLGSPPIHAWHIGNFNFDGFPDGPLTIHYVIFDQAGNATHYAQDIFLAINRPHLLGIRLGTRIGGDDIFTRRDAVLDPIYSNFRVRNDRFSLRLEVSGGTGDLRYDVAHVTRQDAPVSASAMQKGHVYTIAVAGTTAWVDYGMFVDRIDPAGITFIARRNGSPNSGTGTVWAYTGVPPIDPGTWTNTAVRREGPLTPWAANDVGTTITFSGDSFTGAGAARPIPDSEPGPLSDGVNPDFRNDRLFIVRATDALGIGSAALLRVDVRNVDTTPPVIGIAHFGYGLPAGGPFAARIPLRLLASEYEDNIVMAPAAMRGNTDSGRRGYVQYHWHNSAAPNVTANTPGRGNADISGRVIFRGRAADNTQIQSISVRIGGTVTGGTTANGITTNAAVSGGTFINSASAVHTNLAAVWNPNSNSLVPAVSGHTVDNMYTGGNSWGFNASAELNTLEHGHVTNWEFAWDSSTHAGVVGNNVPITFEIIDSAGGASGTTRQTIWVNIVPYITKIETPLSQTFSPAPSAFNRSARGWYPVRENNIITIRGFNLGGGTGVAATAVTLNGTTIARPVDGSHPADTSALRTLSIGTTAASGPLVVTVTPAGGTGITSINNRNHETAHYNLEPNNVNNNTLTDDRFIYVWRVGAFHANANEFPFLNPVMRMNSNSNWVLAYGGSTTSNGEIWVARNSTTASFATTAANRWRHIGVSMDSLGNLFTIGSDQTAGSTNFRFLHRIGATGQAGSWNALTSSPSGVLATAGGDRFMLPRIATQFAGTGTTVNQNNPVRIALSYFDTLDNANNNLRFHFGVVTGASPATLNAAQIVANNQQTHQGSMFTAVGFLSTGRPVIAWFDRTNMRLVLSHGSSAPGATATSLNTTTAQWQANARIVHGPGAGNGRPTSPAGSHVDMVIDANNYIHLAYFDVLNGGLYYALIPPSGAGADLIPNVAAATIVRVDTFLSAGTRIMLNVRRETHAGGIERDVPYISYFHSSFDETRSSVRVAWQRTFPLAPGSDANDRLTGAWEVMTVPVNNVPASGQIIANGVPSSGTLSGTVAGDANLLGTTWPGTTGTNNITRTMLVAYLTTHNFEGAILRYDIVGGSGR